MASAPTGGSLDAGDGVTLWFRSVGEGRAHLLVPGSVIDADLEPLAAQNRRVVFYDSRNRGRSSAVDDPRLLGFSKEVADLGRVRSHLGIESAALLGWSYLAGVVACYATAQPNRVERIVLVSPIPPVWDGAAALAPEPLPADLARLDQLHADGLAERDPVAYCEEWRRVYLGRQLARPEALDLMRSRPCDHPNEWPDHAAKALAHVLVEAGRYDWRRDLGGLDLPVLVIRGQRDPAPRQQAVEWVLALPQARLLELPESGRLPWIESPSAFFDSVGQFLDGRWPDGSHR